LIVVADIAGLALARSEPSILLWMVFWERRDVNGLSAKETALIQQLQAVASPDELAQSIRQFDNGESLVRCSIRLLAG
jgi:hypothetical protein